MEGINLIVVISATIIALITDLKDRMIYRRLTLPVLITGLIYSLYGIVSQVGMAEINKTGITVIWHILQAWIGPVLFIFLYSLLLFWLGILDGGDGQFLIAITPWLGARKMVEIIFYFYPVALLYLLAYLFYHNKFDIKKVARQQYRDLVAMFKNIPTILSNIKTGEAYVLKANIPYESEMAVPPAGMIPISIAVIISTL